MLVVVDRMIVSRLPTPISHKTTRAAPHVDLVEAQEPVGCADERQQRQDRGQRHDDGEDDAQMDGGGASKRGLVSGDEGGLLDVLKIDLDAEF